jgi:hypothetical protein
MVAYLWILRWSSRETRTTTTFVHHTPGKGGLSMLESHADLSLLMLQAPQLSIRSMRHQVDEHTRRASSTNLTCSLLLNRMSTIDDDSGIQWKDCVHQGENVW